MPLTKYAAFSDAEVLDVKGSKTQLENASLSKVADYDDYRTDDGYLYVRIRAISSRVNKNHDGWPSIELAGSSEVFDRHLAKASYYGQDDFFEEQYKERIGDPCPNCGTPLKTRDNVYDVWSEPPNLTPTCPADCGWHAEPVRDNSQWYSKVTQGFSVTSSEGNQEYGFATFMGKPIFVDHHNSDPSRARGVIVDSRFNVLDHKTASSDSYWSKKDIDPEHLPAAEVELLLEVDANSYPKLAKSIISGDIDGFSMGCDVDMSKCSHCGNEASSPDEYCDHIKNKGAEWDYHDSATGARTSKKSYENCYGIKFFEISAVFDPADETALAREVRSSVNKEAQNPAPQVDMTKAPEEVDTLRKERVCPVCGSDMDDEVCQVCGYEAPPENFDNPDLHKPDMLEDPAQGGEQATIPADPATPPPADGAGQSYLRARNSKRAPSVRSDMAWTASVHPRVAEKLKSNGDEPEDEVVVKDETEPVTSSTRTAQDMIAAADRNNQEKTTMADQNKVAAEPADPSAKPDKQVDTEGVGGVIDATNEQASKADAQVDVEGKGGVADASNEQAAKPDEKQDVEKEVTTDDSGPTKTFDNSNEPDSAVTDKAFPTSAKKGTDPVDPVGKADERVDVEQEVAVSWNGGDKTDQWTGTDGNGVTRQADPVTTKPTQSGGVTSKVVTIFKLADEEVKLGLTPEERKYERIAELEGESEEALNAQLATISRVKTAGLGPKVASSATRVPRLAAKPIEEEKVEETPADDVVDSALFTR